MWVNHCALISVIHNGRSMGLIHNVLPIEYKKGQNITPEKPPVLSDHSALSTAFPILTCSNFGYPLTKVGVGMLQEKQLKKVKRRDHVDKSSDFRILI